MHPNVLDQKFYRNIPDSAKTICVMGPSAKFAPLDDPSNATHAAPLSTYSNKAF
jgi:hypothetical protein